MAVPLTVLNDRLRRDERGSAAKWWRSERDRIVCELCPRACVLKDGDRGFCFVRQNVGGRMVLTTYGRSTGFCIDPIEKKPLNHFFPGTSVLSFGTAGCNLGCKFCQNWDISKSREIERLSDVAAPEAIARAASELGCASVAFTYNDPVIWAEYAIDTARACHAAGVRTVAVTAGYICPEARAEFFAHMDAANVDLKAFTEEFYYRLTLSHLQPVLDTLRWLKHETDVWFEITNLVIPRANDDPGELQQLCDWILRNVGDEVPVHFTAFHPDYRLRDRERTPHETLIQAREIALGTGLKYVYVGNVSDVERQSTYCPNCRRRVIERNWHALGVYALAGDRCVHCGTRIAGRFAERPGTWGRRRMRVDMSRFQPAAPKEDPLAAAFAEASEILRRRGGGDPGAAHNPQICPAEDAATARCSAPPSVATAGGGTEEKQRPVENGGGTGAFVELTGAERSAILAAARRAIVDAVAGRTDQRGNALAQLPDRNVFGVFTSIKRCGRLRACRGVFGNTMSLGKALVDAARSTATSDPRFPRISPSELPYLDLEVWVLFAPEPLTSRGERRIQDVVVGRHGLLAVRGNQRGLLLPGVATDNHWDAEQFLNQVCIKAGLPPTAWREDATTVLRFQGIPVRGPVIEPEQGGGLPDRVLLSDEHVAAYADYCRGNILALIRGATPSYYFDRAPDASVLGALVQARLPGGQDVMFARMNLQQPMPLQATLMALCEQVAGTLRRRGFLNGKFDTEFAVLFDAAVHGTVADPDLRGVRPANRAVLVKERNRTGLFYDAAAAGEAVLQEAARAASVFQPEHAQVFSLQVVGNASRFCVSAVPRPIHGPGVRPPAVAGSFYPADPGEMDRMLDAMIGERPQEQQVRACMVPHAGWRFSGRLAADVLKRIAIPEVVIAIGPKHTALGVDWAVAPHHYWQLPGDRRVASDYALARRLADRISNLQLDAMAHAREHGVEVELPIIHRLAPNARVVAIAIGPGALEHCEQFAEGLAEVVRGLSTPPLLLISSDMNHYASDAETRRLDAMALERFDALDADGLFRVCRHHHISMCGLLPAVVVLKTLQRLGQLRRSIPVGYATSADVTGDRTRVVGYAGRLLL